MQGQLKFDSGECGEENLKYPLMQYTGLKDKNGKEVFEGDVLKCDLWGDSLNGTAVVKYDPPSFCLDYSHNIDNFPEDFADKFYKFKIIGNIYENPELLETKEIST